MGGLTGLSSLDLCRAGALVYPVMLCEAEGEISESKAAELLGMRVEDYRGVKAKAVQAVLDFCVALPSPVLVLLGNVSWGG